MNKKNRQHLETVVNATVNEDVEGYEKAFHLYVRAKTQAILLGEGDEDDEGMDDKPEKKSMPGEGDEDEGECPKCHCDPCECDDEDEGHEHMEDEEKSKKKKK